LAVLDVELRASKFNWSTRKREVANYAHSHSGKSQPLKAFEKLENKEAS
jgi:hypothetical protein